METINNVLVTVSDDEKSSNDTYIITDEYGHPMYGYSV